MLIVRRVHSPTRLVRGYLYPPSTLWPWCGRSVKWSRVAITKGPLDRALAKAVVVEGWDDQSVAVPISGLDLVRELQHFGTASADVGCSLDVRRVGWVRPHASLRHADPQAHNRFADDTDFGVERHFNFDFLTPAVGVSICRLGNHSHVTRPGWVVVRDGYQASLVWFAADIVRFGTDNHGERLAIVQPIIVDDDGSDMVRVGRYDTPTYVTEVGSVGRAVSPYRDNRTGRARHQWK